MRRLLNEPLLHFIVLGALLFGGYGLFGKKEAVTDRIVVSAAQIANLADGFARTWRRAPTVDELRGLIEEHIKDEVFYREGKAAGLDRDDVIIKRRVRQKLEFVAGEIAVPEPTEEQLGAYLSTNPERFRIGDRLSFRHVFLSNTPHADANAADVTQLAAVLAHMEPEADWSALGDPFLLGNEFRSVSQSDIARAFGDDFANQLFSVEKSAWKGPIRSGYGSHFVFVSERTEGKLPPLGEIRAAVKREWENASKLEADQKFYRTLRDRYEVIVEPLGQNAGR